MERRRFLAIVMTVMMVISLIPSMVFAAAPSVSNRAITSQPYSFFN